MSEVKLNKSLRYCKEKKKKKCPGLHIETTLELIKIVTITIKCKIQHYAAIQ